MSAQTGLTTYSAANDDTDDLVYMLQRQKGGGQSYIPRPPLETRENAEELRETYLEQGVDDVAIVRVARSAVSEVIDR